MASTNLSKTTDEDLLRLPSRKAEAFGVFCDRFERDVLAFFWRRTRRADLAADLTAEVIETAISIPAAVSSKGRRSVMPMQTQMPPPAKRDPFADVLGTRRGIGAAGDERDAGDERYALERAAAAAAAALEEELREFVSEHEDCDEMEWVYPQTGALTRFCCHHSTDEEGYWDGFEIEVPTVMAVAMVPKSWMLD